VLSILARVQAAGFTSHFGEVAVQDGCGARGLIKTSCAGNEKKKAII
jgi:hypothetical protein